MIHLKLRTEYSINCAVGKIERCLSALDGPDAAITDRDGTWGHVRWAQACKAAGKKPIFGVELACVLDMDKNEKQPVNHIVLLARNDRGLRELYQVVSLATEKFYYHPRIDYGFLNELSHDLFVISGPNPLWQHVPKKLKNFLIEQSPGCSPANLHASIDTHRYPLVSVGDNLYPFPQDVKLYEVVLGDRRVTRTMPGHILQDWEWDAWFPGCDKAVLKSEQISEQCNASLPKGELVKPKKVKPLRTMCMEGARVRKLKIEGKYKDRLNYELGLIEEKKFEDYFYLVADMINWAKKRMFVGPARGSSCGSLVCYLLGITDIDPLPYDLLFERFIDINRLDYPDIDIDFQDDRREQVFEYLRETYGHENVSRLGTVNLFKAKSALGDAAKQLQIPEWEIKNLKDSILERSTGDSRAQFCILDTFESLEIGRTTLAKYPELRIAAEMEGHVRHTGMHAAGILVTAQPATNYCSINHKTGTAMLDKKDAEKLGLLKIDALGLRTLSVLQATLDQVGWDRAQLQAHPLNDKKAFRLINEGKFAGIFQYEGYVLQSLCGQMTVDNIEDIIVITALARPGPLDSGGANEFIARRTGKKKVTYLHPLVEKMTQVTYGVVVYQEQVMQIAREVGMLSWEDTSELRKAMSKSLGQEFFDKYWERFLEGARKHHKMKEEVARVLWENINTMGSWAFNRSHAVAYGMMSYWCLVLKANFPLQFAAACLQNAKDDEQSVKILRELVSEGYKYKPFCPKRSLSNWSVQGGELIGGLTAIKGIGEKLAQNILRKREEKIKLTPREEKLMAEGKTPWDEVFECATLWGHIFKRPRDYGIESALSTISEINEQSDGTFVIIAKISSKDLRDHNEEKALAKRKGERIEGQALYLNMVLEDDTGTINAGINRFKYLDIGVPILEDGKIGDWYVWKGVNSAGFRKLRIRRYRKLTGNELFAKPKKVKKIVA